MSRIYNVNHKIKGTSLDSDWNDSHAFVVDHVFFTNLGLGTFSINEIADWIFTTNMGVKRYSGVSDNFIRTTYPHISLFANRYNRYATGPYEPIDAILGYYSELDDETNNKAPYIDAWRNSGRNGEHISLNIENWSSQVGDSAYGYGDLNIEDFNRSVVLNSLEEFYPNTTSNGKPNWINWSKIDNLIQMNNYVNLLERIKRNRDEWSETDKARYEFISDVRASKGGAVEWFATIPFVIELPTSSYRGQGAYESVCIKEEKVNFKLHLYGNHNRKSTERRVAIQKPVYAQPKTNPIGTTYVREDERGMTKDYPSNNPNPSHSVAAEMSMVYSELEGKWESGTQQIFAILQSDLAAAEYPEDFNASDETVLLSPSNGFGIKTGYAMPVFMKNKNPKQWTPQFKLTKEQRAKTTDETLKNQKVIIPVFNPFDQTFSSGDAVILQKIQGVWMPLRPAGSPAYTTVEPVNPNWEFMYLMTNSMNYFVNKDRTIKLNPLLYEQAFYNEYYRASETGDYNVIPTIDITENKDRYSSSFTDVQSYDVINTNNNYFQITSWDYMGKHFGGTRGVDLSDGQVSKNVLSATRFGFDAKNQPIEDDGYYQLRNSPPFFGCVFVDGYAGSTTFSQVQDEDRDFALYANHYKPLDQAQTQGINVESAHKFFYNVGKHADPGGPFTDDDAYNSAYSDLTGEQRDSLFVDEVGNFYNLPADIATNCSPNGKNGWPVQSIGNWQNVIQYANRQPGFRGYIKNYFSEGDDKRPHRYSWISKRGMTTPEESGGVFSKEYYPYDKANAKEIYGDEYDPDTHDESYSWDDHVFDLKPNTTRIEFRPLSQEVYSQFEMFTVDAAAAPNSWTTKRDLLKPNGTNGDTNTRGEYGYRAWQCTGFDPNDSCISSEALARNWFTYSDQEEEHRLVGSKGLKYNLDIVNFENNGIPKDGNDYTEAVPRDWWNANWHNPQIKGGAGAAGVIGAAVTVASRDQIVINTENALGVDGYWITLGAFQPEFGRSQKNGDYSDLATSNLYATIYTGHPRELTVYDPRFFVVHHFNDGANADIVELWGSGSKSYTEDELDTLTAAGGALEGNDPRTSDKNYNNGWFKFPDVSSEVDLRSPTYADVDSTYIEYGGSLVPIGTNVFSDSGLRNKNHWLTTTQRRGKLLPYSYKYNILTIDEPYEVTKNSNVARVITQNPEETVSLGRVEQLADQDIRVIITNPGSGYSKGDLFTLSNNRTVVLKVTSVGNWKKYTKNSDGTYSQEELSNGVTGLSIIARGAGMSASDFLPSDEVIEWIPGGASPSSSTALVSDSRAETPTEGEGFVGYVISGKVIESAVLTDEKPKLAVGQREIKLTPNFQFESSALPLQEQDPQNTPLSIVNFSEDNKYDIFFHYHNDVSHTRINFAGIPLSAEQMVRVNIVTNADSNAALDSTSNETVNIPNFENFDDEQFILENMNFGLGGLLLGGDLANDLPMNLGGGGLGR